MLTDISDPEAMKGNAAGAEAAQYFYDIKDFWCAHDSAASLPSAPAASTASRRCCSDAAAATGARLT